MRGPKPKPPGMSKRRPDRPDSPEPALPRCPAHLRGEARREWVRMGRLLLAHGLVTELDKAALALYCQAWGRWVEAEEQIAKFGVVIKGSDGYPVRSPYLPVATKAMEQMTRLLVEFGMTPSARSRVELQPKRERERPTPAGPPDGGPDPRELMRVVK